MMQKIVNPLSRKQSKRAPSLLVYTRSVKRITVVRDKTPNGSIGQWAVRGPLAIYSLVVKTKSVI